MQLGEAFHHGEPQTGAFKLPAQAAVKLNEGGENLRQSCPRHPDPRIHDPHLEIRRGCGGRDREAPLAPCPIDLSLAYARDMPDLQGDVSTVVREFDRVGQQIVDDLRHFARVDADQAQVLREIKGQANLTRRGDLLNDREAVRELRRHRDRVEIEPHLARIDLGQVEDVIDEGQQMGAASGNVAKELLLPVGQPRSTTAIPPTWVPRRA